MSETVAAAPPIVKSSVPRIQSLLIGRGVAATMVVLHHSGNIAAEERFFGEKAFGGILERFTGVGFFFVLSGFFIGWISWKLIGRPDAAPTFFTKRLKRIYPCYWVILVPLLIGYYFLPSLASETQRDPINAIFSFFLLPYPMPPVYGVAWTLVHEFLFTCVISILIAVGSRGIPLLFAWAFLIVAGGLLFESMPFPVSFFLSASNLQFLIGVFLARLIWDRQIPAPGVLFCVGLFTYFSFMLFGEALTTNRLLERLILGTGCALMIAGVVGIERRSPFHPPFWLAILGSASFGIYLAHPITLAISARVLNRAHFLNEAPVEVIVMILTAAGVAAGLVFHFGIEKPVTRLVHRLTEPNHRPAQIKATGA